MLPAFTIKMSGTDVGGMPQRDFLRSIDLLGSEVRPAVRHELGAAPADH